MYTAFAARTLALYAALLAILISSSGTAVSAVGVPNVARTESLRVPYIRGFTPDMVPAESTYERAVDASPNAAAALRYERALAGRVHRMGQPADHDTAVYVRNRLAADGWDARIVTYVVPIAWPVKQQLTIVSPLHESVDLYEPAVRGDPWSYDHAAIGKPYSGYSIDGDVSGPVIYVNYGTAEDFKTLAKMGVSVRGAILVARFGRDITTLKAVRAAKAGARAMFTYPEPNAADQNFPRLHAKAYPLGAGRPVGAAMRNTLTFLNDPGDPTAIDGVPLPGTPHKPLSPLKLPQIPFSTITALAAQQLARNLGGPAVPPSWKTNLRGDMRIGGVERAHFVLKSRRFFGPIWNVIAVMKGAYAPQETVVVGGHRDAWTFGATDPISGTVDLLQLGDAFGRLRHQGWRPYRTVIIGSWDGEELNLWGSDAWVRQHQTELTNNCWAYINTDEVAVGPVFFPYGTDDLHGLMRSVARMARGPDGTPLDEYWAAQAPEQRAVQPLGNGSDHESFAYHANVAAMGASFYGIFGTYHSAYDDLASLKVFDPGMRYAQAAARVTSLLVLRLADAPYPDVRLSALARAVQRRLNAFSNARDQEARRATVVRALEPGVSAFQKLALRIDNAADDAAASGNEGLLTTLRAETLRIRSAFYAPEGIPGDSWHRSLIYSSDEANPVLPSLDMTLDPKKGGAALRQLQAALDSEPRLIVPAIQITD